MNLRTAFAIALSLQAISGCSASDDIASEFDDYASSEPYSCWDGSQMLSATAYYNSGISGIVRYEIRDRNGFVQSVTAANSAEWECNSDQMWEFETKMGKICADPDNTTEICEAFR